MLELETHSPEETYALGLRIGGLLAPGAVVGLDGDLGTGKTWLAKGIVSGIGEHDSRLVKSPAFNLVHEYRPLTPAGEVSVFHIDFYRLEELSESDRLMFDEYFTDRGICLVEWASRFLGQLAPAYLAVSLGLGGGGDNHRRVAIGVAGEEPRYREIVRELSDHEDPAA